MDLDAQTHGLEVALEACMHLQERLLEAITRVSEAAESRLLPGVRTETPLLAW